MGFFEQLTIFFGGAQGTDSTTVPVDFEHHTPQNDMYLFWTISTACKKLGIEEVAEFHNQTISLQNGFMVEAQNHNSSNLEQPNQMDHIISLHHVTDHDTPLITIYAQSNAEQGWPGRSENNFIPQKLAINNFLVDDLKPYSVGLMARALEAINKGKVCDREQITEYLEEVGAEFRNRLDALAANHSQPCKN